MTHKFAASGSDKCVCAINTKSQSLRLPGLLHRHRQRTQSLCVWKLYYTKKGGPSSYLSRQQVALIRQAEECAKYVTWKKASMLPVWGYCGIILAESQGDRANERNAGEDD